MWRKAWQHYRGKCSVIPSMMVSAHLPSLSPARQEDEMQAVSDKFQEALQLYRK